MSYQTHLVCLECKNYDDVTPESHKGWMDVEIEVDPLMTVHGWTHHGICPNCQIEIKNLEVKK